MTAVPRIMLVPVLSQEEWWDRAYEGDPESDGQEIPCPRHGIVLSECACITEHLTELRGERKVSIGTKDFVFVDYAAFQELFGRETVALLKERIPMEGCQ